MSSMMQSERQSAQGAAAFITSSETTWNESIDDLQRFYQLKDDWDGEGAEAPHPAIISAALDLAYTWKVTGHPPADRVIAGVNGTVYFEWYSPEGYQEIEVTSPIDAQSRRVAKGSDTAAATAILLTRRA